MVKGTGAIDFSVFCEVCGFTKKYKTMQEAMDIFAAHKKGHHKVK